MAKKKKLPPGGIELESYIQDAGGRGTRYAALRFRKPMKMVALYQRSLWDQVRNADPFRDAITRFDAFAQEHLMPKNLEFAFVMLDSWDLRVQLHEARDRRRQRPVPRTSAIRNRPFAHQARRHRSSSAIEHSPPQSWYRQCHQRPRSVPGGRRRRFARASRAKYGEAWNKTNNTDHRPFNVFNPRTTQSTSNWHANAKFHDQGTEFTEEWHMPGHKSDWTSQPNHSYPTPQGTAEVNHGEAVVMVLVCGIALEEIVLPWSFLHGDWTRNLDLDSGFRIPDYFSLIWILWTTLLCGGCSHREGQIILGVGDTPNGVVKVQEADMSYKKVADGKAVRRRARKRINLFYVQDEYRQAQKKDQNILDKTFADWRLGYTFSYDPYSHIRMNILSSILYSDPFEDHLRMNILLSIMYSHATQEVLPRTAAARRAYSLGSCLCIRTPSKTSNSGSWQDVLSSQSKLDSLVAKHKEQQVGHRRWCRTQIWFVAIDNVLVARISYLDIAGITTDVEIAENCPLSWARVTDMWTASRSMARSTTASALSQRKISSNEEPEMMTPSSHVKRCSAPHRGTGNHGYPFRRGARDRRRRLRLRADRHILSCWIG
ncbi:hypothetical protein BU23DRAFT_636157 [Bimuria novae-zelandiae CBS 107.79]|uniref:Uncharacterized protein n=1 Tax=Bimuria novae-zelandiae CBS 107.79 TaxID=1447943 RepID=A0A6A5VDW6_9PLEO|nr:hypothetical protein BU23DRAFT_636157 [Bimuria novae-zelandiae CBS 107.79]